MDQETWKSIPKYEGYYEVSDQGRVRSLDRYVKYIDGNKVFYEGKILNPSTNNGYLRVGLCKEGTQTYYKVHSLVMLTFVGERPKEKEVAHNNGIKADNRLVNLRYATHKENQHDRWKHGTSNQGERSHTAKLINQDVIEIRKRVQNESRIELAYDYNVTMQTISQIVTRRTWKHI